MKSKAAADPLKPRKQPGQRRSAETVSAILEASARILEDAGFEGYTTNRVAELAGVSIGSLYQYFPNKDSITRALIVREMEQALRDVEGAAAGAIGRDCLGRMVAAAVTNQLRRPVLARLLDVEEARLPPDAAVEKMGDEMDGLFRRCLTADDLPPAARAAEAVGDLIAIIRGMVDAAGRRGETDSTALLERVNRAVFGYLSL